MSGGGLTRRRLLLEAAGGVGTLLGGARTSRAGTVATRPTPLIPRRVLFAGADRSVVRLSPDGRRLAFLAPVDGVLNLWTAPVADVGQARALTRVTDRDLGPWLAFMPNSRHILFEREQGGDENWQIHRADVESGELLAAHAGTGGEVLRPARLAPLSRPRS